MSIERRSCAGSDPQVTKRLFTIIVLMIGLLCIFGGYLLGRMARNEVKRNNDLLTFNLTTTTDILYKKAKRISPKAVHHNDSDKIRNRLTEIFNCTDITCTAVDKYDIAEFVKNSINYQVAKLLKSVNNATMYLDTLR